MTKVNNKKDAGKNKTISAESEKKDNSRPFYPRYWYRQVENLWKAIEELQNENNQLRAQLKGEY